MKDSQNQMNLVPMVGVAFVLLLAFMGLAFYASYKVGEHTNSEQLIKNQMKVHRLQDSLNIYKADAHSLKSKLQILENERINNSDAFNRFNERFGKRASKQAD
jgi:biopolymer transport protein ExbD